MEVKNTFTITLNFEEKDILCSGILEAVVALKDGERIEHLKRTYSDELPYRSYRQTLLELYELLNNSDDVGAWHGDRQQILNWRGDEDGGE